MKEQLLDLLRFFGANKQDERFDPLGSDYVQLERRVVFSAAPVDIDIDDIDFDGTHEIDVEPTSFFEFAEQDLTSEFLDPDVDAIAGLEFTEDLSLPAPSSEITQLLVIDSRVPSIDSLLDGVDQQRHVKVLVLDASKDGVAQISAALNDIGSLSALHIISHGDDGQVLLGNTMLSADNLGSYTGEIAKWNDALEDNADLLFYGCDLAATSDGVEFADAIAELTGADVAASDDLSGHSDLGGDWDFEYIVGAVETNVVFSVDAQQNWYGTLDITTGLVAHFEFEEGGGNTIGDSSATGNDGSFINAPTWTAAAAVGNSALDFSSDAFVNSFAAVPDNAAYDFGTGEFSVALWYRASTPALSQRLIGNFDGANEGFAIRAEATGEFSLERTDGVATLHSYGSGVFDSNWHQLTVTVGTAGDVSMYVDGVSQFVTGAGGPVNVNTTNPILIGAVDGITGDYDGALDDVRIYNRALSAFDVGDLVASVNDAPAFSSLDGIAAYTEGESNAVPLDIDATVFDSELSSADDFGGAVLTFERVGGGNADDNFNRVPTSDLTFTGSSFLLSGVTKGSYGLSNGTLTLTFVAGTTNDDVNEVMQSIGYRNFTDAPPASVDIQWTFSDGNTGDQGTGGALTATGTTTVDITAVNDLATTDLDANDDRGTIGNNYVTTFNGTPVLIVDSDAIVVDPDSTSIFRMDVKITNLLDGTNESLAVDTSAYSGINSSYNSTFGSLIISGEGTHAEYEAILRSIEYDNSSATPDGTARSISVEVTDGGGFGAISYSTIEFGTPTDLSSGIELNTDGGNDAYLISDTGLATSLTATTFEIQFAANDGPDELVLMSFNNAAGDEYSIQINVDGGLELDLGTGNEHISTAIDYPAVLQDGQLHSLAVTWDISNGDWTIYLDGLAIDSGTGLSTGRPLDTTNGQFVFGQEQDGLDTGYAPHQQFSGIIYDVRIWDEVRSAADIALNYQNKFDPAVGSLPSGLVANWQMDGFDGSDQVVDIVSGNNLSVAHALGTGFTSSTPVGDLHIAEDAIIGASVGFAVPTDVNETTSSYTFTLTDPSNNFEINSSTGEITVAATNTLEYETNASHDVTVEFTDAEGNAYNEVMTITVDDVNDVNVAPVVDNRGLPQLTTITEDDLNNSGNTVSEILASDGTVVPITDADGDPLGIAITSLTGNGTWQFDIGTGWTDIGAVSTTSGLLLGESDPLRYIPDGENAETAIILFQAWDQTTGVAGAKVDPSVSGGTTAFSNQVEAATIAVSDVNDAPVMDNSNANTLTAIQEDDRTSAGDTIADVIASSGLADGITDPDAAAVEGVAIFNADTTNGSWEYSTDGGSNWIDFGSPSSTAALLLSDAAQVRFIPTADFNGTAFFSYLAWDQTSGVEGGTISLAGNTGGTQSLSSGIDTATITVYAVNDAPHHDVTGANTLTTIEEDDVDSIGNTVAEIIASSGIADAITDVDAGAVEGIAISTADITNGRWEYSIDGGSVWIDVGDPSQTASLLLSDTARLRFVPNADFNGTSRILYRAWDQTSGTEGSTLPVGGTINSGGTTSIGQAIDSAVITVNAVNDAPVLSGGGPTLNSITEDEIDNDGEAIADILGTIGNPITDVDAGAVEGIAVIVNNGNGGTWQYSTDGGANWQDVGAVGTNNALLLRDTDLLRMNPNETSGHTSNLGFRAWDQTVGVAGTKFDVASFGTGGTSAFSLFTDSAQISVTDVNDAPSGTDNTIVLLEDGVYAIATGTFGLTDIESNGMLSVIITTSPTVGTLELGGVAVTEGQEITVAEMANLLYVAALDVNGVGIDSFTFQVRDDGGTANGGVDTDATPNTIWVDVVAVNDAPESIGGDFSGNEDANSVAISISGSDRDGTIGGYRIISLPTNGTLYNDAGLTAPVATTTLFTSLGAIPLFYVPDADFNGVDTFEFTAIDNEGLEDQSPATIAVTIAPVNDAPVLNGVTNPAFNSITEDDINNPGETVAALLAQLGDPITDVDAGAIEGIAVIVNNGNGGTWQYSIDGGSLWQDVDVVSNASALLLRDTDLLRMNPNEISGHSSNLGFRAWDQTAGSVGTKFDIASAGTGGTSAFSLGVKSAQIFVSNVNDAPIVDLDADDSTDSGLNYQGAFNEGGGPVNIVDSDSSIVDLDHSTISSLVVRITNLLDGTDESLSVTLPGGSWVSFYNDTNGELSIVPGPGSTHADWETVIESIRYSNSSASPDTTTRVITFEADDGTDVNSPLAESHISIGATNQPPVLGTSSSFAVNFTENNGPVGIDTQLDISDLDSPMLSSASVSIATNYAVGEDSLQFTNQLGINGLWDSATGVLTLSGPASVEDYQAALRTITYDNSSDAPNQATRQIEWSVNDGNNNSNVLTRDIDVTPVNDDPVAVNDTYSVDEGGTLVEAVPGVLGNDSDVDNDNLSAILVSAPAFGTLTLNSDGSFSYTHDGSETTSDSFTYQVQDGNGGTDTATVLISVNAVNDAPVGINDNYSVAEGGSLSIPANGVLANDGDDEGSLLTASLLSAPTNGTLTLNADGSFDYLHDGSETTSDSFTYQVQDGNGGTDTAAVLISVNAVNDAPVAIDDNYSVAEGGSLSIPANGVLANDGDDEGALLTASLLSAPTNGTLTLNADGSFDYLHDGSETTSDSFTYQIFDGVDGYDTATVSITVTPQNDAPTAVGDTYTVQEGGTLNEVGPGVLGNDGDADGDPLVASLQSGPSNGVVILNSDGSFTYTHDGSESTSDSFTYEVTDGNGGSDATVVTIQVNPTNDAPVVNGETFTINEGGTVSAAAPGVLSNDSDVEGDALFVTLVTGPLNGTLTLAADGSFTYVHDGSATNFDSFVYSVADGNGGVTTGTVVFSINSVDSVIAASDTFSTVAGNSINIPALDGVLSNDFDPTGAGLSSTLVSPTQNGSLTLNPDGSFRYVPLPNFIGTDSFTYIASDGTNSSNPVTVLIDVSIPPGVGPGGGDTGDPDDTRSDPDPDDSNTDDSDTGDSDADDTNESADDSNPIDDDLTVETVLPQAPYGSDARIHAVRNNDGDTLDVDGDALSEFQSTGVTVSSDQQYVAEQLLADGDRIAYRLREEVRSVLENLDTQLVGYYQGSATIMWDNMDVLRDQIQDDLSYHKVAVGTATVLTSAATLSYLVWTVRGGYLLATFVSVFPAWKIFDPLAVVNLANDPNKNGDDSLADMVADSNDVTVAPL